LQTINASDRKYCAAHITAFYSREGAQLRRRSAPGGCNRFPRQAFPDHRWRGAAVDLLGMKTVMSGSARCAPPAKSGIDQGDQIMIRPTSIARARLNLRFVLGAALVMLFTASSVVDAQVVQGVQQGAREGNKAAGPVGGVLGGAIGGVVGVFTGVLGVGKGGQQAPPPSGKQAGSEKAGKAGKGGKGTKQAVLTQPGEPQLTAEQIVANSDANIERIKTELKLTPEQEKHWTGFNSAMHYLGHNGADRLNLRIARAKRDPPDDIIEQMRNEAQFLNDRAVDQRNVADAAEPLFASLDAQQKALFIEEMVRLSRERGLD
jgi:hypothetical protein